MRLIRLLLKYILSCKYFLPNHVNDDEYIVRCVYSSFHLKKNGDLQKCFYSPQATEINNKIVEGGVSTVRRKYSKRNFIKHHCKCQEKPENKRSYYGMAYLLASEIRQCKSGIYEASVISTPTQYQTYKLSQHADILYGFVPKKFDPLPNDINMIIESLLNFTKKEKDEFPELKEWRGTDIRL